LSILSKLADLMGAIAGGFEPERAGNLPLAELSLKLGRFRELLGEHLGASLPGGHRSSQILILAALHSETGDAEGTAYRTARELRYSEAEAALARTIMRCRDRASALESDISDLGAHRYFRDCGTAGVEAALIYLAISFAQSPPQDLMEVNVNVVRNLFEAWFEKRDQIVNPAPLLRGDELAAALELSPGPVIGKLLAAIAEQQVQAEIQSPSEAIEFARNLWVD
jgi:hypothetical protein